MLAEPGGTWGKGAVIYWEGEGGREKEEENNNSARFLQAIGGDDEASLTKACQEYEGEQLDDGVCVCLVHDWMMVWIWFCVLVTFGRVWSR